MDDHSSSSQQHCWKSHDICGFETNTRCKQRIKRHIALKKNNRDIHKIMHGITNTMNPLKLPATDNLYCLSTGKKVSVEVRDDLVNCVAISRTWCVEFKEECLRDEDRFQKPIPRRKLKTFTSDAVKSKVKSHDKLKIMELTGSRDLLGRLLYLSAMSDLDLQKVVEYPLMPVPLSLANIDGAMHNPSKSKLARKIEDSVHSSTGPEDINVVMVDAIFFRTQTERHSTYGEVARCLLSKLVQMAPLVQLICDTYIHPSIKDPERMKTGDSSETVYSITGPNQNVPRDWQKALDSSSFKESFLRFLSTEWQRQEYGAILGRQIYLALDHKCFRYTVRSGVIVPEQVLALNSEHEEADTLIIYHLHKLTQEQPGLSISVRCDDTDVLLLLLYHVTIPDATSTSHKLSWRSQTHPCLMRFLDSMPSLAVILQPHSLAKGSSDLWRGWRKSRDAWKHLLP